MRIFDANAPRPQACIDADPDNNVCQILGNYTLRINHDKPGSGDFAAGSVSVLVSDGKAAPAATASK